MYKDKNIGRLYTVWYGMKLRCQDPQVEQYRFYGARGIIVCDLWSNSWPEFKKWALANGYQRGLQIDRINNDGPYSPDNCRWVTHEVNDQNKRENPSTIRILKDGKYYTIREAAKAFNLSIQTIHARIRLQWTVDQLFIPPLKKGGLMIQKSKL